MDNNEQTTIQSFNKISEIVKILDHNIQTLEDEIYDLNNEITLETYWGGYTIIKQCTNQQQHYTMK